MLRSEFCCLDECADFTRMMRRSPSFAVHALAALITLMFVALIAWAGTTKAEFVVIARGRVRSVQETAGVFAPNDLSMIGAVSEVHVKPGDPVRRGDLMIRLNPGMLENKIEQLDRQIVAQHEELRQLETTQRLIEASHHAQRLGALSEVESLTHEQEAAVARRESEIRAARLRLATAQTEEVRSKQLLDSNAGSHSVWLRAHTEARQAEEQLRQAELPRVDGRLESARQSLDIIEAEFKLKYNEVASERARRLAAIDDHGKERENLQLKRQSCDLVAPFDGVVTAGLVHPGDVPEPGAMLCEVAPSDGFAFEASVAGDDVGDLQLGMPVCIRFDTFDPRQYGMLSGRVEFIAPDSQTSTDPRNGSESAAYCVRIELEQDRISRGNQVGQLKLGLTGLAEITIGRRNLLSAFAENIRHSISIR